MLIGAEFGTGEILWSILWLFLFILWVWLVITIFADIIRSDDLSGWGKAGWALAIIIFPFLGILIYLIVRGSSMHDRSVHDAEAQDQAMQNYIRRTAGSGSSADQLARLADMHSAGQLSDDEYAEAKAKVLDAS